MALLDPFALSLRRHKVVAGLIVLQVALTTVLMIMAGERVAWLLREARVDSGLPEHELQVVQVHGYRDAAAQAEEMVLLRRLPGVVGVARSNQMPYSRAGWATTVAPQAQDGRGKLVASVYIGDPQLPQVLGLELIEGRRFNAAELRSAPMAPGMLAQARDVILSAALARRLFPMSAAVGQQLHIGPSTLRVVGVVRTLPSPYLQPDAMLLGVRPEQGSTRDTTYVLRLRHGQPAITDERLTQVLDRTGPGRVLVDAATLAQRHAERALRDRLSAASIAFGAALWLLGTLFCQASLAELLVQGRREQIGIRRAIGARTRQIDRQLRIENLALAAAGVSLGWTLLLLLSHSAQDVANLLSPGIATPLLTGAAMVALGQLAMWAPARHAAAIPPSIANRRR